MIVTTIKVKPWGAGQGEFVEINESDFDPTVHTLYEPEAETKPKKQERKR